MTDEHPVDLMATLWEAYQIDSYGQLLPAGQQHTECKRAFYGGAAKSMMALTHLSSPGPVPTQADIDLIAQLMQETHVFFQAEAGIFKAMMN